jgi:long-chain fatty acid transport protein
MKRITLLLVAILSLPIFSYSGGIVTNQNQSASYIRMFARDASTDIDAVFLTLLV